MKVATHRLLASLALFIGILVTGGCSRTSLSDFEVTLLIYERHSSQESLDYTAYIGTCSMESGLAVLADVNAYQLNVTGIEHIESRAAPSPDNKQIAFYDTDGGISVVDIETQEGVQVATTQYVPQSMYVAWSSDASRLAYIDGSDLYVVGVDGSEPPRLVAEHQEGDYAVFVTASEFTCCDQIRSPVWDEGGEVIFFDDFNVPGVVEGMLGQHPACYPPSCRSIYQVNVEDLNRTEVLADAALTAQNPGRPGLEAFVPADRRWIAIDPDSGDLSSIVEEPQQLFPSSYQLPEGFDLYWGEWSTDGRSYAMPVHYGPALFGERDPNETDEVRIIGFSTQPAQIDAQVPIYTGNGSGLDSLVWTRDSRYLAYGQINRHGSSTLVVRVFAPETEEDRKICEHDISGKDIERFEVLAVNEPGS